MSFKMAVPFFITTSNEEFLLCILISNWQSVMSVCVHFNCIHFERYAVDSHFHLQLPSDKWWASSYQSYLHLCIYYLLHMLIFSELPRSFAYFITKLCYDLVSFRRTHQWIHLMLILWLLEITNCNFKLLIQFL